MDDIVSNFLTNYQLNQHSYEELESQLESIMKGKLKNKNVGFIWQSRVKKAGSLEEKLRRAKKAYTSDADIFTDIRDLVAGRIILTRWDDFRIIADLVKEVFTIQDQYQHPKTSVSLAIEQPRFRGYDGQHYYVDLPTDLDAKYKSLIQCMEIQVMSAFEILFWEFTPSENNFTFLEAALLHPKTPRICKLSIGDIAGMFAYNTIDHDFIYKEQNGQLSEDEIRCLDLLRGTANLGEVALQQFEAANKARLDSTENSSAYIPPNLQNFNEDKKEKTIIATIKQLLNKTSEDSEKAACLKALFLTNPIDDRKALIWMKGSRVDGTCMWIKDNELYKSWLHSPQLLWLSGGPGKGKTMLSIFLAQELEELTNGLQHKVFLQYFCDNKDEKRNTAVAILRGLIFQLLQLRPTLFHHILPSFRIQKESLFTASSFQALWRIFETMVRDPVVGTAYCILDGLDECDKASLEKLLSEFKTLFSTESKRSVSSLSLIVVSREFPEFILEILSGFSRIRLDPDADTEVNTDIERFIDIKVDELAKVRKYPHPLSLYVKDVFRKKAQGTFLWVGIAAKMLKNYRATEVEVALELFPPGLDELYGRILLQIDNGQRETVAKILLWVVMAVRPLTLLELSALIEAPKRDMNIVFSREEMIRDQLIYCGYFLTIKEDEGNADYEPPKVNLIHQSAKDYLLRKIQDPNPELEFFRVKEDIGNSTIVRRCLDELENGDILNIPYNEDCRALELDFQNRNKIPQFRDIPLLNYAMSYWPHHARLLPSTGCEDVFDLTRLFFNEFPIREHWWREYNSNRFDMDFNNTDKHFSLLHLTSYLGIVPLAGKLLKENMIRKLIHGLYLNKCDSYYRTALIWAVLGGHAAMIQFLLKKGANIDHGDIDGDTALYYAGSNGREDIVRLLLEQGARTEARNYVGETALMKAVRTWNSEAIIGLLVEKGANIEAKNNGRETVLHLTVRYQYGKATIQLLLEKGANIEARNYKGETVLFLAAQYWHRKDIIRLLLEKGANFEARNNEGETVLFSATRYRYGKEIIRLLLEKGANIEAKNNKGETALFLAAQYLYGKDIIPLLLEKGADIEARNNTGDTVLIQTAKGKDNDDDEEDDDDYGDDDDDDDAVSIICLLLDRGANIEARNNEGKTALAEAKSRRKKEVVELLLKRGAKD